MIRFGSRSFALLAVLTLAAAGARAQQPARGLVVHEWGVITLADDIDRTAELPGFVHRVPPQAAPVMDPPMDRKPIVYFYSDAAASAAVRVEITLPPGSLSGAVHYPDATVAPTLPGPWRNGLESAPVDGGGSLRFDLRLAPGRLPDDPPAWWTACRVPDARPISLAGGREGEGFLFYEMPIRPPGPPVVTWDFVTGQGFRYADVPPAHAGPIREIDLVVQGAETPLADVMGIARRSGGPLYFGAVDSNAAARAQTIPLRESTPEAVRSAIRGRLVRAGLREAETDAMLAVWGDSFWGGESFKLFLYRLDPRTIDALVPLTVTPAPSEVTRVWLVAGR